MTLLRALRRHFGDLAIARAPNWLFMVIFRPHGTILAIFFLLKVRMIKTLRVISDVDAGPCIFEVFVVVAHEHVIDFVNGGPDVGGVVLVAHEQVIDVVNVGPDVDNIDVFLPTNVSNPQQNDSL